MPTAGGLDEARSRWERLWLRLGVRSVPEQDFARIVAAYGESHRSYHDLGHVLDCLRELEPAAASAERLPEVEAALWFHDVVYDPRRDDNEVRSAAWAREVLEAQGVAAEAMRRIEALVLATRHGAPGRTPDERLVVDVDLSILGRDPASFAQYEQGIRREYAFVPELAYREARARVLRAFLARSPLFSTPWFHAQYERPARRNLGDALGELQDAPTHAPRALFPDGRGAARGAGG